MNDVLRQRPKNFHPWKQAAHGRNPHHYCRSVTKLSELRRTHRMSIASKARDHSSDENPRNQYSVSSLGRDTYKAILFHSGSLWQSPRQSSQQPTYVSVGTNTSGPTNREMTMQLSSRLRNIFIANCCTCYGKTERSRIFKMVQRPQLQIKVHFFNLSDRI